MTINVGDRLTVPSAACTDPEEGDLPLTINNYVDTSTEGNYVTSYSCTDSQGLRDADTVRVSVVENAG